MRKRKIDGQYVPHLRELIGAPAWRALSRPAKLVLDRIEIEHMRHRGQDNGKLAVTFDDFVEHGVHRNIIASAIRECVALGLLVITRRGCAGNAEFRAPNLFLLPYLQADTLDSATGFPEGELDQVGVPDPLPVPGREQQVRSRGRRRTPRPSPPAAGS